MNAETIASGDECVVVDPFVEGTSVGPQSTSRVDVTNPSERGGAIPAGSEFDVGKAIASLGKAFDAGRWSEANFPSGKLTLNRLAEHTAQKGDHLGAGKMGKPVCERFGGAMDVQRTVRINGVVSGEEGLCYSASSEPNQQSSFRAEGGVAGMETNLRREQVWISHA